MQFGEGGAGTFSDGKLWSGISDPRHHGRKVLEEFVRAGAPEEILWSSKPHIGTFRLVTVVEGLRATIEALGGEYRFGAQGGRPRDREERTAAAVSRRACWRTASGSRPTTSCSPIGHSARDTMAMLHRRGVRIDAKPLSIGVRIEHPQALIDRAALRRPRRPLRGSAPPTTSWCTIATRRAPPRPSVYSFCMCPGGTRGRRRLGARPARHQRHEPVFARRAQRQRRHRRRPRPGRLRPYGDGPLAGIAFQRHWEERAFEAGGGDYRAPGATRRRLPRRPALAPRSAASCPPTSPASRPTDLAACLPDYAVAAIREALPAFDRRIPGFAMADAVMTGVETRTSSPVRIPRGPDGQSVNTAGLFPAGEGAGYAGGILSAGVDGIRTAEAVALSIVDAARIS